MPFNNNEAGACDAGSGKSLSHHDSISHTKLQPSDQGSFYRPKSIKRPRRLKFQVKGIKDAIKQILEADHPQTVRQVFYQLTVLGLIAKAEGEYHQTIIRLLGDMREAGEIPFEWVADNTRWMRKPS